jgi:hypothetical protein
LQKLIPPKPSEDCSTLTESLNQTFPNKLDLKNSATELPGLDRVRPSEDIPQDFMQEQIDGDLRTVDKMFLENYKNNNNKDSSSCNG